MTPIRFSLGSSIRWLLALASAFSLCAQAQSIVAVAAGSSESAVLALRSDGTILAWGENGSGQLGDGTNTARSSAVIVKGLTIANANSLPAGTVPLAVGLNHSVAVSGGNVWTWGNNNYGQLGVAGTSEWWNPTQGPNLSGVKAVAAGNSFTLALMTNGDVWAWGYNGNGALGDGTNTGRAVPAKIGINNVVAIAAGQDSAYALKSDGTVWAWGYNANGQLGLGLGDTASRNAPVQVTELGNTVTAISGGGRHALALKSDQTVWAWGYNASGQLGNASTSQSTTPVPVKDTAGTGTLTGATGIAAGYDFSLALISDGTVMGWGRNDIGSVGDNTATSPRTTPQQTLSAPATPLTGVGAVAASAYSGYALMNDGTLRSWGYNDLGQLGDRTITQRNVAVTPYLTPSSVSLVTSANPILAGASVTFTATVSGATPSGNVSFFDGTTQIGSPVVPDGSGVAAISTSSLGTGPHSITARFAGDTSNNPSVSASLYQEVKAAALGGGGVANLTLIEASQNSSHVLARRSDGALLAWGYNANGQLGDGTSTSRSAPIVVQGISGVAGAAGSLAAGNNFSLAVVGGNVFAWGNNGNGQLGVTEISEWWTPTQIPNLSGVTAVAAGNYYGVALKGDGTVWTWGYNGYGQLGDNSTTSRAVPAQVSGLLGVIAIAAGTDTSYALKSDGTVWAWGYNGYGQLGLGDTGNRLVPTQITALSAIGAIAAGERHAVALKSDGSSVWTWGYNADGELGDGTDAQRNTPVQVFGLGGVSQIAAGSYHTLALKNDGTVWAWGYNNYGALGNTSTQSSSVPRQVLGLPGTVNQLAGGDYSSFALKSDGTVWAWGYNANGRLGDGT
ncbi:MAG: Ig-like domain repeat protein, partial [Burkholderiales bacterium]|nr:Ig-like domain repeat protein [Burkholderiales bacterium]